MEPVTPAAFSQRYQPLADGCFRDIGALYLAADGSRYVLEWTPTLNTEEVPQAECMKLIAECTLAGGGWDGATPEELATLSDRTQYGPDTFSELKADTQSDWYWSKTPLASSPDLAWFVGFNDGGVSYYRAGYGFARGVRRVVVSSPGQ